MKKKNNYFAWGLTAVVVVCTILLFYDIIFRSSKVLDYLNKLTTILAPVLYGFAMAYLLTPVVNWFERTVRKFFGDKTRGTWLRAGAILFSWLLVGALLYALMSVLLPELYKSLVQLAGNAKGYYDTVAAWVQHLLENNPEFAQRAGELFTEYYQDALLWLNGKVVPQIQVALGAITGGVWGLVVFLKNLLIGVIVSVYLLATKETFASLGCKLSYAFLNRDHAALLIRGFRTTNRIFSGFVRGKLLDSLIIGILCFVGMTALRMPYAMLISVVVGVTNIIPFFGPFIGAIPSGLLILLIDPLKALYFVLFILALQQFDGNILGPKILGDSTGLSSFWVMFAILLAGGLFGFVGMVVGVPLFAVLYSILSGLVCHSLRRRGMPEETQAYYELDHVDERTHDILYNEAPARPAAGSADRPE